MPRRQHSYMPLEIGQHAGRVRATWNAAADQYLVFVYLSGVASRDERRITAPSFPSGRNLDAAFAAAQKFAESWLTARAAQAPKD